MMMCSISDHGACPERKYKNCKTLLQVLLPSDPRTLLRHPRVLLRHQLPIRLLLLGHQLPIRFSQGFRTLNKVRPVPRPSGRSSCQCLWVFCFFSSALSCFSAAGAAFGRREDGPRWILGIVQAAA
jgi:hypothetical protein